MKLGVFTVSTPEYYPLELMDKLSDIGYDGIEWRVVDDNGDKNEPTFWSGNRAGMTAGELIDKSHELIEKANNTHLSMPSLGAYIDCDDMDKVELHFTAAKAIGAHNVRVNPGAYNSELSYVKQIEKAKESYCEVASLAKQYELRACIETHMKQLAPSMSKAMAILDGLDPKYVGIMWDPANQIVEGLETFDMAIDIAGDYLAEIHAKNLCFIKEPSSDGFEWQCRRTPIDQGQVDWQSLITLLKQKNYTGWIFTEDFSTCRSTDEKLLHNYNYFKHLFAANGS